MKLKSKGYTTANIAFTIDGVLIIYSYYYFKEVRNNNIFKKPVPGTIYLD